MIFLADKRAFFFFPFYFKQNTSPILDECFHANTILKFIFNALSLTERVRGIQLFIEIIIKGVVNNSCSQNEERNSYER